MFAGCELNANIAIWMCRIGRDWIKWVSVCVVFLETDTCSCFLFLYFAISSVSWFYFEHFRIFLFIVQCVCVSWMLLMLGTETMQMLFVFSHAPVVRAKNHLRDWLVALRPREIQLKCDRSTPNAQSKPPFPCMGWIYFIQLNTSTTVFQQTKCSIDKKFIITIATSNSYEQKSIRTSWASA